MISLLCIELIVNSIIYTTTEDKTIKGFFGGLLVITIIVILKILWWD